MSFLKTLTKNYQPFFFLLPTKSVAQNAINSNTKIPQMYFAGCNPPSPMPIKPITPKTMARII